MSRIFLSHSSKDWREAVALKQWLADQDPPLANEIFLDLDEQAGIATGVRWKDALKRANARCEAVICLLSPNWEASSECKVEYRTAENLNKQILCARLAPSTGHDITAEWQRCDLFGDGATTEIAVGEGPPVVFATEGLLRLRDGIRGAGISAASFVWPLKGQSDRAPYRGWEPFEESDAGVFFGRDAQIVRALDALRGMRRSELQTMFVVLGPSGTGKSSFLRAGLLPRLRREDRRYLLLGILRPERRALTGKSGLAQAIYSARQRLALDGVAFGEIKAACSDRDVARIRAWLTEMQEAAAARLLESDPDQLMPSVVLPVDQAEELFAADAGAEAPAFLSLIRELAGDGEQGGLNLIVAVTIRTDRYEAMQTAPDLAGVGSVLFDELKPMPATQFKEIITGPAVRSAQADRPLQIEPALVDRLLADATADSTEGGDTLPLLSLTLWRLFTDYGSAGELTAAQYEHMGGMRRVVQTEIDEILSDNPIARNNQLTLLREAFIPWLATIDPDSDQPMRRVARWQDLPAASRPLIDAFVARRLMVKDSRGGETVVEVALESLLRQWDELFGWLREERENLKAADDIERAASAWESRDRDDDWLLKGTRLADAETLAGQSGFHDRLTAADDYLSASRQRENDRVQAEQRRQYAELETTKAHARVLQQRSRILRAVLVATVLVALIAVVSLMQANSAKRDADSKKRSAIAFQLKSQATATLAGWRLGDDQQAFQQILAAQKLSGDTDDNSLLQAAAIRSSTLKISETGANGRALAVSPDGRTIATSLQNGTVELWDATSGQRRSKLTTGVVWGVAFSPDGQRIATAMQDKTIQLWGAASGQRLNTLNGHAGAVWDVAFSADGRRLASSSEDTTVRLWDVDAGRELRALPGNQKGVNSVAFSRDGHRLASAGDDHTVRLWDADTGESLPMAQGNQQHTDAVWRVVFSPDGHRLASASLDQTVKIWNVDTGDLDGKPLTGHTAGVTSLAFDSNGSRLASSSFDGTVRLWDVEGRRLQAAFVGHAAGVSGVAFMPPQGPQHQLASLSFGSELRIWDIDRSRLQGHSNDIYSVAFSPDGLHLASASADQTVLLWDAETGSSQNTLRGHTDAVYDVAFSPDGHRLATGSADQTVRLWDAETGNALKTLTGHGDTVYDVAFSPDGHRLASASADRTVRLWDADTGNAQNTLRGHTDEVTALAFSPDGRTLASASADQSLRLWNVGTGESSQPIQACVGPVTSLAFNPDGASVATACRDGTVTLWDVGTRKVMPNLPNQGGSGYSVAFSPDGKRLAGAGSNKTVWVWDLQHVDRSVVLPRSNTVFTPADESYFFSVAFSSKGLLAIGGQDRSIRLYPAKGLPSDLCAKLSVNMSHQQWKDWVSSDLGYETLCPGLPTRDD